MAFLLMPITVQFLPFVRIKPLKGYVKVEKDTNLTFNSWFSGIYQEQYEKYLKQQLKIRPLLVRIYNQIRFIIQQEISAANVVMGKNGYFYERHYIWTHQGIDFSGDSVIRKKVFNAKRVIDSLEKHGVKFLLVLAPGKAEVIPEYIPDEMKSSLRNQTNYLVYRKYFNESGLCWIDFNHYFNMIKDTTSFPLYSKGGTHWSIYGSYIALDTILKYMEKLLDKDLPDYNYPVYEKTKKPKGTDRDIANAANLLWYNFDEVLLYPYLHITDTVNKYKPDIIVIGDSYYWTIVNNGVQKLFFNNYCFWYYFKENHSNDLKLPKSVDSIPYLKDFVENQDLIMYLITDGNLREFSWNFIETMEKLYGIN